MSIPRFVYHFACPQCRRRSDEYPAFAFPDLFSSSMLLPSWSREPSFYGTVTCDLTPDDEHRLRDDHQAQVSLAQSLTSAVMTVGVPAMRVEQDGRVIALDVTPHPGCPYCGSPVEVRWGYPPADDDAPPAAKQPDDLT